MDNIKFHREKQLPSNPTPADDGLWYVKPNGEDDFEVYIIKNGVVSGLTQWDLQKITDNGATTNNSVTLGETTFYKENVKFSKNGGVLIKTDITENQNKKVTIEISGYNGDKEPFYCIIQAYFYSLANSVARTSAISNTDFGDIKIFKQNGEFRIWFDSKINGTTSTYRKVLRFTFSVMNNATFSVEDSELPTGVAIDKTITPKIYSTQDDLNAYLKKSKNLDDLDNASAARSNLGLGGAATKSAGYYARPSDIPTNNNELSNGAGYITQHQSLSGYLKKSKNLDDLDNASAARSNLGLGGAATKSAGYYARPSDIPTNNNELSNGAGYITRLYDDLHPRLKNYLNADSKKIKHLADPTADKDAANKQYVDEQTVVKELPSNYDIDTIREPGNFFILHPQTVPPGNQPGEFDWMIYTMGFITDIPNSTRGDIWMFMGNAGRNGHYLWVRTAEETDSNGDPKWSEWMRVHIDGTPTPSHKKIRHHTYTATLSFPVNVKDDDHTIIVHKTSSGSFPYGKLINLPSTPKKGHILRLVFRMQGQSYSGDIADVDVLGYNGNNITSVPGYSTFIIQYDGEDWQQVGGTETT